VGAVIIGASGFEEAGTAEGLELQRRLARLAGDTGMRIVGPNCNGLYNAVDGISLGFNAAHGLDLPPGGTAILSHSGALFSTMMLRARRLGLGLGHFVSVGNEVDLDILDHLEYLLARPTTRVACLVIDSLPDGERFSALAEQADRDGIRLLVLKLGSTASGSAVAVAHSSRLAGRQDAYRALLRARGVGSVDTVEQLMTTAALLDRETPVRRDSAVGSLVMSGGAGALLADSAERHGVPMASFTPETTAALEAVATTARPVNPVDTGFATGKASVDDLLTLIGADAEVDVVVSFYHARASETGRRQLATDLAASRARSGKPHVMLAPVELTPAEIQWYGEADVLVVDDTDVCFAALAAAAASGPSRREDTVERSRSPERLEQLSEVDSLRLLGEAGVPVIECRTVRGIDAAVAAAAEIGWPVVLKGEAPGVAHKSDLGLVAVGLEDEAAVRRAAERMAGVEELTGFVVQPMVAGPLEALVGLTSADELGRFVVVGTGGIHAEAIADTALVPVDAPVDAFREALLRTRLGHVLTSARWHGADTVDQVVATMTVLAALAQRTPLVAVDVNPLVLTESRVIAVDALVIRG
jgi:acyl-CoA synthetase (NDP forming)